MTKAEKLEAMELLWDAISHDSTPVQSPSWHKGVLDKRREKIVSNQAHFITLEKLKERLR
ncbi:addiction module protein [Limihaloglobus sulfuriphilus]|nr:addiction module protein [Limihaloglobus sulfuriphilus]